MSLTCKWKDEDDTGVLIGDYCGKPARWISCVPYEATPTCDEHKCRCAELATNKKSVVPGLHIQRDEDLPSNAPLDIDKVRQLLVDSARFPIAIAGALKSALNEVEEVRKERDDAIRELGNIVDLKEELSGVRKDLKNLLDNIDRHGKRECDGLMPLDCLEDIDEHAKAIRKARGWQ